MCIRDRAGPCGVSHGRSLPPAPPDRHGRTGRMADMHSGLSHLECSRCGAEHDARLPPTLWRYAELLPVSSPGAVVTLGEPITPLLPLPATGRDMGVPRLLA